jgi:two-component system, LytTR family, sensor histidine kinase AlgZ
MHPILTRPERLALYLGAWTVIGVLIAGVLSRQGLTLPEALVLVLPLFLAYSFVCLSAWYVCRAVPLRSSGPLRVLVASTTSSALAGGIWLALAYSWIAVFESMPDLAAMAARDRQQIPLLLSAAVLLFLLALAVTYLGLAFEEAREAEKRQYELEAHARNAELRALRAQLDPHFLYNCLNSIASLTSADAGGARRMCLLLAEFLRSTLHVGALARIPLGDELALADRFLAIEQVRFGDRLQIARRIDPSSLAARVPPLFLQPLVENAVTHGIAEMLDGGTIMVDVNRAGDRLAIAIENPCDPDALTPMRHGTGMTNVRQRLNAMFGSAASMSARAEAGRFRVDISLPYSSDDQ